MKLTTLRLVGWLEALSFLALLGVAVPMKYMAGQPLGVRICGPIHGLLFIIFLVMVLIAKLEQQIDGKLAVLCGVGALLPFGPLLYHAKLNDDESLIGEAGK